jgi:hypothetical protein
MTYYFGRAVSDELLNMFAMKMASVFMFWTCAIGLRTGLVPRWVAQIGYASAVVLLLVISNWRWITLVFPGWMLLVSAQVLRSEFRSPGASTVPAS